MESPSIPRPRLEFPTPQPVLSPPIPAQGSPLSPGPTPIVLCVQAGADGHRQRKPSPGGLSDPDGDGHRHQ